MRKEGFIQVENLKIIKNYLSFLWVGLEGMEFWGKRSIFCEELNSMNYIAQIKAEYKFFLPGNQVRY